MTIQQFTFEYNLDKPIFFYCKDNEFSHPSICLAEGLKELGLPFYSNINYWKIAPDREEYLFTHSPNVSPDDCSIVILDQRYWYCTPALENIFHSKRRYVTVYIDDVDGPTLWNPDFNNFDLRFRLHYNKNSPYPSNCIPWVFGLSNRILKETSNLLQVQAKIKKILVNFRVDQKRLRYFNAWLRVPQGLVEVDNALVRVDHPIRKIALEQLLPLMQKVLPVDNNLEDFDIPPSDSYHHLQWVQTGQRHYPDYYKRLRESIACACFGGCITLCPATGKPLVEWWDSWRFWESLAAGCVTFHVDFDKYGIQLPVMPQNWRHYIGIDLENIQDTVDRIAKNPGILEQISTEGRRWAIENYGPVPTAVRFLETVNSHFLQINQGTENPRNLVSFSLPVHLTEINLIIFPDWSQAEDNLGLDLEKIIRALVTHPEKTKITLLIHYSNISDEDANLALSSVVMNLLMEEDLDVSEGPEISLIGQLSEIQWQTLMPRLYARIILDTENKKAIALVEVKGITSGELDNFNQQAESIKLEDT